MSPAVLLLGDREALPCPRPGSTPSRKSCGQSTCPVFAWCLLGVCPVFARCLLPVPSSTSAAWCGRRCRGLWGWDGARMSPVLPLGGCNHPGHPRQLPQPEPGAGARPGRRGQLPAAAAGTEGFEGFGASRTVSLAARLINTRSHGTSRAAGERGKTRACRAVFRRGSPSVGSAAGLSCEVASSPSPWAGFFPFFLLLSRREARLGGVGLITHPCITVSRRRGSWVMLHKALFPLPETLTDAAAPRTPPTPPLCAHLLSAFVSERGCFAFSACSQSSSNPGGTFRLR